MRDSNIFYTHAALIALLAIAPLLFACSSSDVTLIDHAVRMNPDTLRALSKGDSAAQHMYKHKYGMLPDESGARDPGTLRGHVYSVATVKLGSDSTEKHDYDSLHGKKYLVFTDKRYFGQEDPPKELIPLEHVKMLGPEKEVNLEDGYWFEHYNIQLQPLGIREVPEVTLNYDPSACNCLPLDPEIPCPPGIPCGISCLTRAHQWYFVSIKGAYVIYNDYEQDVFGNKRRVSLADFAGELTAGIRFRGFFDLLDDDISRKAHWGLGLQYSTGVPLVNTFNFDEAAERKQTLMLHFRRQFDDWLCMFPFVYANAGIAIDGATLDLAHFAMKDGLFCNCKEENDDLRRILDSPVVDISFPLSYAVGVGVDIPIHRRMDISLDLGWRRIAFAETVNLFSFADIPSYRAESMWVFRAGLTF